MKLVRYESEGKTFYGELEGGTISPLEGRIGALRRASDTPPRELSSVRLLAPVLPGKIVAVGLNYRDHAREVGKNLPAEPMLFLKPSTAVIAPGEAIAYPHQTERLDYEGELAIVIGRRARNVCPADAAGYILGFTCMNDVTARDLQARDVQFTRAKGFDTFAPIGPLIATDLSPHDLAIETRLNGETRQKSRTSELIFDCAALLSFISGIMTLMPGDVISTGTPSGVGPMQPGDTVEVEIEHIGCLRNTVAAPA